MSGYSPTQALGDSASRVSREHRARPRRGNTLVLLERRRIANYAFDREALDLNTIPLRPSSASRVCSTARRIYARTRSAAHSISSRGQDYAVARQWRSTILPGALGGSKQQYALRGAPETCGATGSICSGRSIPEDASDPCDRPRFRQDVFLLNTPSIRRAQRVPAKSRTSSGVINPGFARAFSSGVDPFRTHLPIRYACGSICAPQEKPAPLSGAIPPGQHAAFRRVNYVHNVRRSPFRNASLRGDDVPTAILLLSRPTGRSIR